MPSTASVKMLHSVSCVLSLDLLTVWYKQGTFNTTKGCYSGHQELQFGAKTGTQTMNKMTMSVHFIFGFFGVAIVREPILNFD